MLTVGIRTGLAAGCAIAFCFLLPAIASATFPGGNGHLYISAFGEGFGSLDIYRVRPDGTGLKLLTDGADGRPDEGSDPSISANARRLAFTTGSQAASDVWVMTGEGQSPDQLTFPAPFPVQGLDQMPGISPNGQRIAFMTTRETEPDALGLDHNIWTMAADGSNPQVLLDTLAEDYYPEFTPDGQTVVMASEVTGDLDIAYVPLAGAPHTSATAITGHSNVTERTPSVHPSGELVAFGRNDGNIYGIDFAGTSEFPIADQPISVANPSYSPDGKKIAFSSENGLVIANANGSNSKVIDLPARIAAVGQIDWASDTIRPSTRITGGPRGETGKTTARFRFTSSEAASTFKCKLDSNPARACKSPKAYNKLKRGEHVFKVRAIDFAGNADATPAKRRFEVVP